MYIAYMYIDTFLTILGAVAVREPGQADAGLPDGLRRANRGPGACIWCVCVCPFFSELKRNEKFKTFIT